MDDRDSHDVLGSAEVLSCFARKQRAPARNIWPVHAIIYVRLARLLLSKAAWIAISQLHEVEQLSIRSSNAEKKCRVVMPL